MSPPDGAHDVRSIFGATHDYEDLAAAALAAARAGAQVLRAGAVGGIKGLGTKTSATDMVSDVDRRAERAVSDRLLDLRPDDGVLAEEGTSRPGASGVRWVVDPLDGTTNFLFGLPQYAVSVAAELDGETVVGVVVDPVKDETFAASKGGGARCNGIECRVASGRSSLATALVATGFGYRPERRVWQGAVAARIIPAVRDVRRFGAASLDLCWTAAGRFDAYYEWGLNPWDLAAGALCVSEAGGRVEVLPGRMVLATSPDLWEPLRRLIEEAGGLDAPDGDEPNVL